MEPSIKFHVPEQYRTFTPFSDLPAEIRHQIWKETLSPPGVQFLKLQTRGRSWRWAQWRPAGTQMPGLHHHGGPNQGANDDGDEDIDFEVRHESEPKSVWDTRLVPVSPSLEADLSYYPILDEQIATLQSTCVESKAVVDALLSKPRNLRLENGHIASLEQSQDVVYLEYFHPTVFSSGCSFGAKTNCKALDNIRRVALRFCHQWQERKPPKACLTCGRVHQAPDGVVYPVHIYQFLARHLPNLEEFYFIDYFIRRKPDSAQTTTHADAKDEAPRCFHAKNRTFYEVDSERWIIKPEVFKMKSWLQDKFVRYAKASKLSRHRWPEKVRFSLLACEWDIPTPQQRYKSDAARNGGHEKKGSHLHNAFRQKRQVPSMEAVDVDGDWFRGDTSKLSFVFGQGQYRSFSFKPQSQLNMAV